MVEEALVVTTHPKEQELMLGVEDLEPVEVQFTPTAVLLTTVTSWQEPVEFSEAAAVLVSTRLEALEVMLEVQVLQVTELILAIETMPVEMNNTAHKEEAMA